ncbi:hypothetical protein I2F27_11945 [Acinetobacter sp. B5B]|uniref:hypothetical protein n=1 Tax=Acinetobacter baretiae TaxID=2605383 RepID=UPI0018C34D5E|nr:hypothetical protein [Acinetobacter baretiae]MBF7684010.1 hypothetical protein [Acinetobacter baretiae]
MICSVICISLFYQTFADLLVDKYNYKASDSTVLWLRGATEANAGRLIGRGNSPLKIDSLNDWRGILYAYYSYKKGVMAVAKKGTFTLFTFLFNPNFNNIQTSAEELSSDIGTLTKTGMSYFDEQRGDVFDKGGTLFQTLWSGSDNSEMIKAFQLIDYMGENSFLDMLQGAIVGKNKYKTTNIIF